MHDHLLFEGLDEAEQRILQHHDELGYVTVHEVVDRQRYETLGRLNFVEAELRPFFDEPGADDALSELLAAPSESDLARATVRWIRHTVGCNMVGRTDAKFKASLWRPKGDGQFYSVRFVCRNPDAEELPAEPAPSTPPPTPLPPTPDSAPEGRVWRALGDGYTHLIGLLQHSFAHLASLQNTTISNQNQQILRQQKVLEELMGEVTKLHVGLLDHDQRRTSDDQEARVREELGKQFISELGTFGRVLAASKLGMSPELAELAELVNASPELMEAMKSPEVRRLLKDEKTRKELAELLMAAAKAPAA